jgi:uncharacterized protein
MSSSDYAADIAAQWAAREKRLRDPMSWLTLVGLWWLEPGEYSFGADPGNQIVLTGDDLPSTAGLLEVADGAARLRPLSRDLTVDGEPAREMTLRADTDGAPSLIAVGSLRLHLIRRGERLGLRVRDTHAPALAAFAGLERFPLDASWRLVGRLEPADGRTVQIVDVTGSVTAEPTPGSVRFEHNGQRFALDALIGDDDGSLWLIFGDATNGRTTYGGGRYLYTGPPGPDGAVVADFNLAYNPPCVFSSYATCPLPPAQNRLGISIEAGERWSEAEH